MPQNHRLQFSVEESICFQKGQEVSELLSISLDPDIRVQEVNDYVSIRGSLELTGEYNIDQNKHTEEFYTDKRFVEEVRKREDGSAELTHCFPVDITIPKNKVSHLQDVFVFIDAFDYQLTDSRILTIQADLAIEGLLDDTADKEPEIPLYEAPAAFREEELSEPPIHSALETDADPAEEAIMQDEPPELFVSKTGLREELETEKAESAPPESVASEPEAREGVKEEAEPAELVVPEAESREESETEEAEPEPNASEIEIQEIVKAEKETPEPAAALADVRIDADSPAEAELREGSGAEESPALEAELQEETAIEEEKAETPVSSILEYALRQEAQNEEADQSEQAESALRQEADQPEQAEPVLRQEADQSEQAEPALRQEADQSEQAEPALRQEKKEANQPEQAEPALRQEKKEANQPEQAEPALHQEKKEADQPEQAEPALHQEKKEADQSKQAEPVLRQEKKEADQPEQAEPALRQEKKEADQPEQAGPALRQEADEASETVTEAVLSIEESRERKPASAAYAENAEADSHHPTNQKASSKEASQEEELAPAYRTFLPEQEDGDSFYSAPKLLEEEEQEEESFEIEVRKIPPAEEPEEETPFQSFQLPETSETERKEADAVPRVTPAAETKESQTKESNNSLYLTKLFTREEDEFSRMKICIVQQEDTIERLCERYEITSQQLIRMNSLALDDELKAGQILYIPQYNNSHA
ncbi:LysM peptidoglycan-binding domain-containing protein [Bacillus inaquosorum]|uniref:LysM peptidoglycan-binding domain-containing protein n=3 Tax=Bacillus inaquosorum TaxID=483913 RepID=UPI000745CC68|nr:LysM peptidoglycan-binding domain-containing protein [Bacillus inaquosorum]CAF1841723.1 Stage VI sporulation protein D [Bacillus subtilis]AMA53335.1 morphogenetic spore protein (stage VI sporulation) [Bacillus inaquosorum]MDZ5541532.1 LysM peptidoglycan-binding domain-containing protein [Bacillus inaquosorum]MEC0556298.1 LysM peptidoglycan-binding domain-containing protein [Bacillus inaquosorum]MEC0872436.1 LysM peptidoglycan-binding domain-containing protein [Bacillus inaquosorum]